MKNKLGLSWAKLKLTIIMLSQLLDVVVVVAGAELKKIIIIKITSGG